MRQVISQIQTISNRLKELDEDSTKWQVPPDILIIDRYADAYAVGFREAIRQIRLIISEGANQ